MHIVVLLHYFTVAMVTTCEKDSEIGWNVLSYRTWEYIFMNSACVLNHSTFARTQYIQHGLPVSDRLDLNIKICKLVWIHYLFNSNLWKLNVQITIFSCYTWLVQLITKAILAITIATAENMVLTVNDIDLIMFFSGFRRGKIYDMCLINYAIICIIEKIDQKP